VVTFSAGAAMPLLMEGNHPARLSITHKFGSDQTLIREITAIEVSIQPCLLLIAHLQLHPK
jgi:hypothetical protein